MSIRNRAPETPDALSPTSWQTAVLAMPFATMIGIAVGIVAQDYLPAWPTTVVVGMLSVWYLSRRESLSDVVGTTAAALIVPVILFPVEVFLIEFFVSTGSALVNLAGAAIVGVAAMAVSVVLGVIAALAFRA